MLCFDFWLNIWYFQIHRVFFFMEIIRFFIDLCSNEMVSDRNPLSWTESLTDQFFLFNLF